ALPVSSAVLLLCSLGGPAYRLKRENIACAQTRRMELKRIASSVARHQPAGRDGKMILIIGTTLRDSTNSYWKAHIGCPFHSFSRIASMDLTAGDWYCNLGAATVAASLMLSKGCAIS